MTSDIHAQLQIIKYETSCIICIETKEQKNENMQRFDIRNSTQSLCYL